ncbi:DNA (cytosine-5-)-methyltransferase [Mycoplasma sp. SG1]|uniref:DNA (cytosine-5-)-methyltransferase n=1 Tax=Mycoplasma sp. SG1 TaxID=2810348 RepID=UPI0020242A6A|nr:DNA (cytosine-5-)-methyltransferase [Mycoplasma sp. SG1]URM53173.1 DNA (cytosine-5-)-methyltransferase [Mycoplasma sp. SG1]
MYKIASFFSGTGGIELAFAKYNKYKVIFFNDFDNSSIECLKANFPNTKIYKEKIELLDENNIEDFDILTGGFPCQPFSVAGLRKGFKDDRAKCIKQLLKIIQTKKPKIVLLENVKNILNNELFFEEIIIKLQKIGYFVKYKILNTKNFSLPQNRERLYIVCFLNKKMFDSFNFPDKSLSQNDIKNFFILDDSVENKYFYTHKFKHYEKIKTILNDKDLETFYQWRRVYLRRNKNNICPTLTANMGTGGNNVPLIKYNNKIRKLTPKECFKLQGFNEDYKLPKLADNKLYKLVGNAVSINVVDAIVKKLNEVLF